MNAPILYQHADGRFGLSLSGEPAAFTKGDPAWYRVPLDLVEPSSQASSDEPTLALNGHQLWDALEFLAPDRTPEQLDLTVCIRPGPGREVDGVAEAPGHYCWLADYPEDGSIRLDDTAPVEQVD